MMKRIIKIFLWPTALSAILFISVGQANPPEPFWLAKPKIKKRVYEDKEIIVSVTGEKSLLDIKGVGLAAVPLLTAYKLGKDFSRYPSIVSFVRSVKYDEPKRLLTMVCEAFGYRATVVSEVTFVESDAQEKEIQFLVVGESFKGMTGKMRFINVERQKTEISLLALYKFVKLPMPQFFVEFGLEVALKLAAGRLRSYVENEHRKVMEAPHGQKKSRKSAAP